MTTSDDEIPPVLRTLTTDRLRQLMVDAATLAGSAAAGDLAASVYRRLAHQCDAVITERERLRARALPPSPRSTP